MPPLPPHGNNQQYTNPQHLQQMQQMQQMQQQYGINPQQMMQMGMAANNPAVTEEFLRQRIVQLNTQFLSATQQLLNFAQECERYNIFCKRNPMDGTLSIMTSQEVEEEKQRRTQAEQQKQAMQMNAALQASPQFNDMAKAITLTSQLVAQLAQRIDQQQGTTPTQQWHNPQQPIQ